MFSFWIAQFLECYAAHLLFFIAIFIKKKESLIIKGGQSSGLAWFSE